MGQSTTGFHSATKGLIDELMKRVNEAAAQNSGDQNVEDMPLFPG